MRAIASRRLRYPVARRESESLSPEPESAPSAAAGPRRWQAGSAAAGARIDRYLAARLGISRNRAARLLAEGRVLLDGRLPLKSARIQPGQDVRVEIPPVRPIAAVPQDIEIGIVYEDLDIAVIDKPAGLVSHPAPGHPDKTLVNALLYRVRDLSGIGGALRPGIVHRLDRDTTGLMVVAKSDRAHRRLSDQLRAREVIREYLAVLWGRAPWATKTVDQPIGRDPQDRKKMAVSPRGRAARTRFAVEERWRGATFCRVRLDTGRTHQIRVHAASIGRPVVGDELYGPGRGRSDRRWARELARLAPRQLLHAHLLEFAHPASGAKARFRAPLPADFARIRRWASKDPEGAASL